MTKLSSPFAQVPFPNIPLFLIPFLLLALIYFFVFPNDFRLQSALAPCTGTSTSTSTQLADAYTAKPDVDFRMFFDVLTRADFYEDMVFGRWLWSGSKGKNVYGEEPRMYDYLDNQMADRVICFRYGLMANTVAVHKLKDRLKWARTLRFFNATLGLKPSKMYHVDL